MIGIDVAALWAQISKLGFAGLLFFVLVGFERGWWFFGRERDELKAQLAAMTKDRDEWKVLAMSSLHQAERTVTVAAAALPTPEIAS